MPLTHKQLPTAERHIFKGDKTHNDSNVFLIYPPSQTAILAPESEESKELAYLKSVTKNRSSCLEKTIHKKSVELKTLEYQIAHNTQFYSYLQVRAWRARRKKLKKDLKFLRQLVADTLKKRAQAIG
jgi:transposase